MATLTSIAYENNLYRIAVNSEGKYFPQVVSPWGWSCFKQLINFEKGNKNRAYKTERGAFKFLLNAAEERMDIVQRADVTTAEWHGENWQRAYDEIKSAQENLKAAYQARYGK